MSERTKRSARPARSREESFLYGLHPVIEALQAERRAIEAVYVASAALAEVCRAAMPPSRRHISIRQLAPEELAERAGSAQHQGVIAKAGPYPYVTIEEILARAGTDTEGGLILVVDRVQDPRNLGAIVRTAAGVGAHGIVIPRDQAVGVTPTVVKASAGATEWFCIAQVTNIVTSINMLKTKDYWTIGLDGSGIESVYDRSFSGSQVVVVGSEGKGLRRLVAQSCDHLMRIPMAGKLESYNVSVATAMTLGEILRQRSSKEAR